MKKISLMTLFSTALVMNTFLMRPAALGQEYAPIAMILSVALVGGYLALRGCHERIILKANRRDILFTVSIIVLYWLYELPLGIVQGSDTMLLAKDFLSSVTITICYAVFLIEENENRTFFRIFTMILALLGWSSIITFTLSQIFGLDPLLLFSLRVKGYDAATISATGGQQVTTGAVYFPFSMMYSVFTSAGGSVLNRYSNFFREAGIYQAVSVLCFAYECFTRRSKFVLIGLTAGTVASLSTLGLVLLPLTAGLVYITQRRVSIARLILFGGFAIVAAAALVFTPAVGLADKLETHGSSVTDRSDAIDRGIESIWINPVGTGLFSEKRAGDSICLLAAITAIGVIGFACQALVLSGIRPAARAFNPKVVICFPLLVTALFSQPIGGSGMTGVLTMAFVSATTRRRAEAPAALSRARHAVAKPTIAIR